MPGYITGRTIVGENSFSASSGLSPAHLDLFAKYIKDKSILKFTISAGLLTPVIECRGSIFTSDEFEKARKPITFQVEVSKLAEHLRCSCLKDAMECHDPTHWVIGFGLDCQCRKDRYRALKGGKKVQGTVSKRGNTAGKVFVADDDGSVEWLFCVEHGLAEKA